MAKRILGAELRSGTADNDPNALREFGSVPDVTVNNFFTDTNAWFLLTDVSDGFKMFDRVPLTTKMDGDFESGNAKFKARQRYSFGLSDPRALYASPGST